MVDDDGEPGEAPRQLGHVAQMVGEDAGKLEHEAALLEERDALEHRGRRIQWGSSSWWMR